MIKKVALVAVVALGLTGCHALPIILPAIQAAMSLPTTLKDAQVVTAPIDTGISAAVPLYVAARAEIQAEGLDKKDPTIAALIAYGDSIANQPVPKGPVGTAVWLSNIAHGLVDEYHKRHPAAHT